jgi:hypothetical protein
MMSHLCNHCVREFWSWHVHGSHSVCLPKPSVTQTSTCRHQTWLIFLVRPEVSEIDLLLKFGLKADESWLETKLRICLNQYETCTWCLPWFFLYYHCFYLIPLFCLQDGGAKVSNLKRILKVVGLKLPFMTYCIELRTYLHYFCKKL